MYYKIISIASLDPVPKQRLTFRQIFHMSFDFFAFQFGFALQTANLSRIFQTLRAEMDQVGYLWIEGPVTGLLVQPIIEYLSD